MYQQLLSYVANRPEPYAPSTAAFWDDEHISQCMLAAHLAPDVEAASRRHAFIRESAKWIASRLYTPEARLLDLGCGPGLYDELFCEAGFHVTGLDLSRRSIEHAKESAAKKGLAIEYRVQNYLTLDEESAYDAATLIYCDFGVLSPDDRRELLRRVRRALKPDGRLLLDAWSMRYREQFKEGRTVSYENGGFWSPEPYIVIESHYDYPDSASYLEQYVVVTQGECQRYNIWNQYYTPQSLEKELRDAGFDDIELFGDVAGKPLTAESETICAIAGRQ